MGNGSVMSYNSWYYPSKSVKLQLQTLFEP